MHPCIVAPTYTPSSDVMLFCRLFCRSTSLVLSVPIPLNVRSSANGPTKGFARQRREISVVSAVRR